MVLLAVFLMITLFAPSVISIALSPPQLRATNVPLGIDKEIADISVDNTKDVSVYLILQVGSLEQSREDKLRVICNNCSRQTGIQRRHLINGRCPHCNSTDLIMYDLPPENILNSVWLTCSEYPLEKIDDTTYRTVEKLNADENAIMEIHINIPNRDEYYGQHWEVRILAVALDTKEYAQGSITYGAETRFLIDTVPLSKTKSSGAFFVGIVALVIVIMLVICVIVFSVYSFYKKKEGKPKRNERKIL